MKIGILHIGDFHLLESEENITQQFNEKIVDAILSKFKIDYIVIIFTGDLTQKGTESEFVTGKRVLDKLVESFQERLTDDVRLFLVPGNHDLDFSSIPEDRRDHIKKDSADVKLLMGHYLNSRISNLGFNDNLFVNKMIVNFENIKMQINYINTALDSPISSKRVNDHGKHLIAEDDINFIERESKVDFSLLLLHHGNSWLDDQNKKMIERYINNNIEIVFYGHEHFAKEEKRISFINSESTFFYKSHSLDKESKSIEDVNFIIIDTELNELISQKYIWDKNSKIYLGYENHLFKSPIISKNSIIPFKHDWREDFFKDNLLLFPDYGKYFVFPSLRKLDDYKKERIELTVDNYQQFQTIMTEKKIIVINGGSNSGKTTLLKDIYRMNAIEKVPVYIDLLGNKVNFNKAISEAFESQYSDDRINFQKYLQLPTNQKILLLDNFDFYSIADIPTAVIENYDNIVITQNLSVSDHAREISLNDELVKKRLSLRIEPFFKIKREKLIDKICERNNTTSPKKTTTKSLVEAFIQGFKLYSPSFITQLTLYSLDNYAEIDESVKNKEVFFDVVFEHELLKKISELEDYKKNHDFMTSLIKSLQLIAGTLYEDRKNELSIKEFMELIDNFNEEYAMKYDSFNLIENLKATGIINLRDNKISFTHNHYCSYFIARYIISLDSYEEQQEKIRHAFDFILVGIYSDIIMFYVYLRRNPKSILNILKGADLFFKEKKEIDFRKKEISFFYKDNKHKLELPENGIKNQLDKSKNDREKDWYDEISNDNQILKCDHTLLSNEKYIVDRYPEYLILKSRILNSFAEDIKKIDKDEVIKSLFEDTQKYINIELTGLDATFDIMVDKIHILSQRNPEVFGNAQKGISKEIIRDILVDRYRASVLAFYGAISSNFVNPNISEYIDESYKPTTINHRLFRLFIIENSGDSEKFASEALKLIDKEKDDFIRLCITLLVRKHLIFNDNLSFQLKQKLHTKFFGYDKNTVLYNIEHKIKTIEK